MMEIYLITPNTDLLTSWKNFVQECDQKNVSGFWDYPERPKNWFEYIDNEAERKSERKSVPLVPSSTFWLVDDGEIVAVTNIRHRLNDNLKKRGGHIGYSVKPSYWKKGYGTKILELALLEAKKIGINNALITCSDSNSASARIIEKNGGVLEKKEIYDEEFSRYYWIKWQV